MKPSPEKAIIFFQGEAFSDTLTEEKASARDGSSALFLHGLWL